GLQRRDRGVLIVEAQALLSLLPGGLARFQEVIIEPAALFERGRQLRLLLPRGIETVLEGLTHISIIAKSMPFGQARCKADSGIGLYPRPINWRGFSPMMFGNGPSVRHSG